MSNQDNDQDSFDTDLGFEDGQDSGGKKNNPLIKIGLIAGGLVAVVVGIMSFGGTAQKDVKSVVGNAPADTKALPAQAEPTPQYREAIESYNTQIIQKAKDDGSSVIPIPVDPSHKNIETKVQESQEDPAERFRRIQEEYRRQQETQVTGQQSEQVKANAEVRAKQVQTMSQAMSSYLTQILKQREPTGTSGEINVTYMAPDSGGSTANENGGAGSSTGAPSAASAALAFKPKVVLPAATIEYGQLLMEANTDAKGPVLALMVTGKLAGSRLLGKFQETDEYLTIDFDTLITREGKSVKIKAIVIDPDTTLPGMITEIDHRYFSRIVVPAAAEFISGVGSAIAETKTSTTQSSSSTTTSSNDPDFSEAIAQGISDSFDGVSEIMRDQAKQVKPMLRIASGTPIGILFTEEVLDPVDAEKQKDLQQAALLEQQAKQGSLNPGSMLQAGYGYPFIPPQYAPVQGNTPSVAPAATPTTSTQSP